MAGLAFVRYTDGRKAPDFTQINSLNTPFLAANVSPEP